MNPERRVAIAGIAGIAQTALTAGDPGVTAPELVFEVVERAVEDAGLSRDRIDLIVSGSSDMLDGRAFAFAIALEAMGAWPALLESHVEMDGAFAAYYAWLKILAGEAEAALVVSWSKASEASLHHVTNSALDPFVLAPLGLDHAVCAALQADAWIAKTGATLSDLDRVVEKNRARARDNAHLRLPETPDGPWIAPLFRRHTPTRADGACALVLASNEIARSGSKRPVWIAGSDHRTEPGAIGHRDLTALNSAALALERAKQIAGWDDGALDLAELHTPYAHQEILLARTFELSPEVMLNPSGGAMIADPGLATGLVRLFECAHALRRAGPGRRGLAHASAGPALEANLVFLLEAAQ
jgi:acetyl-CoA acetyltransferase